MTRPLTALAPAVPRPNRLLGPANGPALMHGTTACPAPAPPSLCLAFLRRAGTLARRAARAITATNCRLAASHMDARLIVSDLNKRFPLVTPHGWVTAVVRTPPGMTGDSDARPRAVPGAFRHH